MQKASLLFVLTLFFSVAAAAQVPRLELFGGYSHFWADLNNTTPSVNLQGMHFSAAENLNKWFGGVIDFSSDYATRNGVNINTQSIMYGPRFSYRGSRFVVPSVHALLGAVRGSPGYLGISKADTHFGLGLGGEVDLTVTKHVAIRLVQADYIMTRFLNLRQDNVRVSAGIVFRIPRW